ncbi:MAG TPA: TIGR03564 family F420-dependent LLM class oxidoreductase [Acidimicrobiales bacterium]|nr:TIGR03564 family F420-dependent LLM class oxidoreductase [Acidimicrobiales bacterium]
MRVGPYAIGTLDVVVDGIRRAEADGFPTVWTHQATGLDPFVAMAVAARDAVRIEIGTALVPAILRHPQALAAEALTAQAALAGRLTLGIGVSHPHIVEGRLGLSYARPAEYMREYLEALLPLLRGEPADVRGRRVTMVGGLDVGEVSPPPVLLGALAPHMLRLAGRLADGTITGATGPRGLAEHVVPAITQAAAEAGRPPPRVVAAVVACITDDPDATRSRIAATSKAYATMPSFKAMLEREGVTSQVEVGLIGSESAARAQAQRLVDAGATDLAVRESTATADEAQRTREFLKRLLDD